jgi:nitrogen fixation/metabolism regulation signal transduction histidine kinase
MKEQNPQPKKRTPPWILGGLVLLFLTLLVILQSSNYWKSLEVESAGRTLLLYALSSLNFFAFIIFGFIFVRSLLKLLRERRTLQLGAKIKTRLLIYFIAISILPIIAMASFSYLFMNRAIERWFTQIPENVVREPGKVRSRAVANQNVKLNETAKMLVEVLDGKDLNDQDLQKILKAGDLTRIEVLSQNGKILSESEKPLDQLEVTELEKTLRFVRENKFDEQSLMDGYGFDVTYAKFSDGKTLVIIPTLGSTGNVSQLVDSSLREFDQLKEQQISVQQIGFLTLGVLTFLLLFASSWMAFYVAKGLTIPIRALAEGADEIAQGNLEHRVEVLAEDELALLVKSFNQMSAELERNSAELSERRKYIETVLQSLSTGVISFDGENRITTINKAAIRMFKLEDANFEMIKLEKLVGAENFAVLKKLLGRARRIGFASEQTILQREYTDGSTMQTSENLPVALSVAALPETSVERSSGVVLVIEDLSELIAAQRASAWQEVARRMAHEIKNPLTPIQLSAERIAKRFALENGGVDKNGSESKTEDQRPKIKDQTSRIIKDGTDTILREVDSLKAMVDEFSRYARLPETRLERGSLNEIINQSLMLYEDRSEDLKFELNLSDDLPEAMFDEEQLKRVFVNLIDNSVEAFDKTQNEKIIFIKTFYDSARDLIIAEVADNGNGIEPRNFQKLFQPYFSTKGRGTGLGLAIVQRIITEHSGRINVASNIPKGAKFIIELPVSTS